MDSVKYSGLHVAYRDYCPGHMKWDYDYSIKDLEPDAIIALWQNPEGAHPHLLGKYRRVNILGTVEDSPKDWPFLRLDSEQIKWDKVPGSESNTPLAE
jgi:hypothetical protein